jgi:hypothetical protein
MPRQDPSAHTDSDHPRPDDPETALRILRRVTITLAVALWVAGIAFTFIGGWEHDLRWFVAGCTLAGLGGVSTGVAAGAYIALLRGRQEGGLYYSLVDILAGLNGRVNDLEAGERHIIQTFREMADRATGTGGVAHIHRN